MLKNPCFDLLTELEQQLIEIDKDKKSCIDKCSQKITICQQLAKELRKLYFQAGLETVPQEIHFFKKVKPKFFSELHYQMEVFQYYKQKPKGSLKNKSQFINICLDKASSFMTRHCEFNTYVQMNATHLDELYFTNRDYCPKLHDSLEHPADLIFSSPADPTLSCLLAATRYVQFLKNEKYALKNPTLIVDAAVTLAPRFRSPVGFWSRRISPVSALLKLKSSSSKSTSAAPAMILK